MNSLTCKLPPSWNTSIITLSFKPDRDPIDPSTFSLSLVNTKIKMISKAPAARVDREILLTKSKVIPGHFHIEQVWTILFAVIIYRDPTFPHDPALGKKKNLPFKMQKP